MSNKISKIVSILFASTLILTSCKSGENSNTGKGQHDHSHAESINIEKSQVQESQIEELPTNGKFVTDAEGKNIYKGQGTFYDTLDTVVTVTFYCQDEETFKNYYKLAHSEFIRLHKLYDNYNKYDGINNVMTINESAGKEGVKVEDDLFNLVKMSKGLYDKTLGKVNIAMGSVLSLWHDEREKAEKDPSKAKLPDKKALEEAAKHTDINKLILNEKEKTIKLEDSLMKLDMGAVAKGYATELVAQRLTKAGLKSGLISAGGNVKLIGNNPMGRDWRVGVEDPSGNGGDPKVIVDLKGGFSLVTSGDYQRYFEVDGKRYHHIIDPITLMPGGRNPSVTIETEDSGLADFLSTAIFLSTPEEEKKILENFKNEGIGIEDIWIDSSGQIKASEGVKNRIEK